MIRKLIKHLKDTNARNDLWILIRYFNFLKTIYINFSMLPFKKAIRMPIIIFGKVSFLSLSGKIILEAQGTSFGMIKLGFPLDMYFNPTMRGILKIQGELLFRGDAIICCGYNFNIAEKGLLSIGKGLKIGSMVNVSSVKSIFIGDYSRVAFETVFMSSSFHFVLDKITNTVSNPDGDIIIGEYNWIGNRSVIYKGVRTPNNCIITSGSILNKDYKKIFPEYVLVGGIPAKLIKENITRIWNGETEVMLRKMFEKSKEPILNIDNLSIK